MISMMNHLFWLAIFAPPVLIIAWAVVWLFQPESGQSPTSQQISTRWTWRPPSN
jgi:hypothetical protein